ncbi:hypothetical protein AVEN_97014-1, partial [Araneus ventricosus]
MDEVKTVSWWQCTPNVGHGRAGNLRYDTCEPVAECVICDGRT